jgi:hypothetical protein
VTLSLSAFCPSRPLPPERFLVLITVRGWLDHSCGLRNTDRQPFCSQRNFSGCLYFSHNLTFTPPSLHLPIILSSEILQITPQRASLCVNPPLSGKQGPRSVPFTAIIACRSTWQYFACHVSIVWVLVSWLVHFLSSFLPGQFLKTKRKQKPSCCQTQIIIKSCRRLCGLLFAGRMFLESIAYYVSTVCCCSSYIFLSFLHGVSFRTFVCSLNTVIVPLCVHSIRTST